MTVTKVTIGLNNFAELRKKANITQTALASLIGVSGTTLSKIERKGGSLPKDSYDNLVSLVGEPTVISSRPKVIRPSKETRNPREEFRELREEADIREFASYLYRLWKELN